MKSLKNLLLALPLSALLGGCVVNLGTDGDSSSNWERTERKNRDEIAQLVLNANEQSVRSRFGQPDFSEGFQKGRDEYRVLFYRTQRRHGDGVTTKSECTALVFKNGFLTGWGERAYDDMTAGAL